MVSQERVLSHFTTISFEGDLGLESALLGACENEKGEDIREDRKSKLFFYLCRVIYGKCGKILL